MLILFYKTYLSRLNLIVFSTFLNISSSLTPASFENFNNIINSFIKITLSKAFTNKSEKKKKVKERENEKIANENKKENNEENKNKKFY